MTSALITIGVTALILAGLRAWYVKRGGRLSRNAPQPHQARDLSSAELVSSRPSWLNPRRQRGLMGSTEPSNESRRDH